MDKLTSQYDKLRLEEEKEAQMLLDQQQLLQSPSKLLDKSKADNDTVDISEFKNAIILYPSYFDKRNSVSKGRRIPHNLAINTDLKSNGIPLTAWHLATACSKLGLSVLVEDGKRYTRDYWAYGRVRVQFDKSQGFSHPTHGYIPNKAKLMITIAKLLPDIQKEHLKSLKAAATAKPSAKVSFELPLDPTVFPYNSNPALNSAMKYAHGALPLVDMRPKTSGAGATSRGSSSKKIKKTCPYCRSDFSAYSLHATVGGPIIEIRNVVEKKRQSLSNDTDNLADFVVDVVDDDDTIECKICKRRDNENVLLLCDDCDDGYHIYCLQPPLAEVPPPHIAWFCPVCEDLRRSAGLVVPQQSRLEISTATNSRRRRLIARPNITNSTNTSRHRQSPISMSNNNNNYGRLRRIRRRRTIRCSIEDNRDNQTAAYDNDIFRIVAKHSRRTNNRALYRSIRNAEQLNTTTAAASSQEANQDEHADVWNAFSVARQMQ